MGDTERKPGTLKDWTKSHKYWGTHRIRGVIVWQCEHSHKTSREASECAFAKLNDALESSKTEEAK